ncbi:MAG: acyl-CoA dehydrogenase family protein [SAR202 cluster bacterium]|nr:acyl-CoA dehydrogenase family protein [SAR202 cluster bacterium]|tara:strand:- start:2511 stop:3668 length:1158 start_codon:yes stop_codon:yes gene_type:complete
MLDYYNVLDLLSSEERQVQSVVRDFLDSEILPHVADWWEKAEFPTHLITKFGEMGLLGANLPAEYGCPQVNNMTYGLIMYELERVDSGFRSFAGVQSALAMYPIYKYGSEDQKKSYLPNMAAGLTIGCFGLTEHEGGSDPDQMKTTARKVGESYLINGSKMWITNGSIADIAIVWAKDEDQIVRGFIVPTDTPGFTANKIQRKMSMRNSITSELIFDDVEIPVTNILPQAKGLSAPLACLTQARFGIAWGSMGVLESVYSDALSFSNIRSTFDKPIASRQLVQDKLVDMVVDHTKGLLLATRLAQLKDAGKMQYQHVSVAKRENARSALNGARSAREILGGSGITLDYSVIRHMLNMETVDTYEGTHDIHTLVIGRDITGQNALV